MDLAVFWHLGVSGDTDHLNVFWPCPKYGYADTPSPLRNGQIFMKDAQCAETNENSIFRFFIFWVMIDIVHNFQMFLPTKYDKNNVSKNAQCSWFFFLCATFSFWDIVDFVLNIHSELVWVQTLTSEGMVLNPKAYGVQRCSPSPIFFLNNV